ncbi:uncharacterized protein LOC135922045 isoform X2 [Gordionus sp. m RMFG-2023]|uniref:uncharacterized protein LOC135922045 isoform X2 n=1 Tax=Gordionus sp. m RMFG-2023 TaxID=3053472 RepID=UPI0031FC69C9
MNMKFQKETSSIRQPRRYPPRIRINDNFPPRLTPIIDQDLGHLCKRGEPLLNVICGPSEGMCPINYECDMRRGLDEFGKCCIREDLCPDQTLALSRGVCRTNGTFNDCPSNFRCIPIALNFGIVNMCCNGIGNFMVSGNRDSPARGFMRSGGLGSLVKFSSGARGMPLMEGLYYDNEVERKENNDQYSNNARKGVVRRNLDYSGRSRKNEMKVQVENGAQSASNPIMMTGLFGGQSMDIKPVPQRSFDQTAYLLAADMASRLKSQNEELHRSGKLNDDGSIYVPGDQAAVVNGISRYEIEQRKLSTDLQPEWISALFSNLGGKTDIENKYINTPNVIGGDYSGMNGNFIGARPGYFNNYQNEEPLIRVSETKTILGSPDSQNMLNSNTELDGSDPNNPYFNPYYDPYQNVGSPSHGGDNRMIQKNPLISFNNPPLSSLSIGTGSIVGGAHSGNQIQPIGSYPTVYNSYNLPPRYSTVEYPSNPAQLIEAYKGQHLPISLQIKANEIRLKSENGEYNELGQKLGPSRNSNKKGDDEDQVNSAGDEYVNDALFRLATKNRYKTGIKATMDPLQFLLPFIFHLKDKNSDHPKRQQPIVLKG